MIPENEARYSEINAAIQSLQAQQLQVEYQFYYL